jgi:uncharacterized protein
VETKEPGEELRGSVLVGRLIFTVIGAVIGIPLIIILFVISAWCHIKGAVRAANDKSCDYPFQIPVLS